MPEASANPGARDAGGRDGGAGESGFGEGCKGVGFAHALAALWRWRHAVFFLQGLRTPPAAPRCATQW